jgi:indole-3-glycerol phosphate synthase/phosphoribosylanthranilate isomerase
LVQSGALDAIQFHGSEFPEEYSRWPGYKAVRIKSEADAEATASIAGPAVLIDAFSSTAYGGTGMRIAPALVASVASRRSLWLAGGITPDNVRDVIAEFHPELIDLSSGVEEVPGKKDHAALAKLFEVING